MMERDKDFIKFMLHTIDFKEKRSKNKQTYWGNFKVYFQIRAYRRKKSPNINKCAGCLFGGLEH